MVSRVGHGWEDSEPGFWQLGKNENHGWMTVIREKKKTGKNQVQHLTTREGSTNYLPYQEERRRGTEEARSSKKPHVHKSACLMATYLTCTLHVFTSHVFEFTLHE